MKSKILLDSIILAVALAFVSFFSCNGQKEQEVGGTEPRVVKKEVQRELSNCCSASCPGGSCLSYVSPCNCYCSITGLPNCAANKPVEAIVEGDFEVLATPGQLAHQLTVVTYFLNSSNPHASAAHALSWNIYNLFSGNNGSIVSTTDLQNYTRNIRDLETTLKRYFSSSEIAQIHHL